jgi:hypothetical protein
MSKRSRCLLLGLIAALAGCALPPAAHSPFLPPVSLDRDPTTDVGLTVGGDALLDVGLRHVFPLGDFAALDLGGSASPSYAGGNGGLWLRTRKSKRGWSGGTRLGGGLGVGYSRVTATGDEFTVPRIGGESPLYFAVTNHWQISRKPEGKKGTANFIFGAGISVHPEEPDHEYSVPENFYADLGFRYDQPTGVFLGVGIQATGFLLFPVPALTAGYRF